MYSWMRGDCADRDLYDFGEQSWPERGMWQLKELGFRTAAMCLAERSICIDDPVLMKEQKLALIKIMYELQQ